MAKAPFFLSFFVFPDAHNENHYFEVAITITIIAVVAVGPFVYCFCDTRGHYHFLNLTTYKVLSPLEFQYKNTSIHIFLWAYFYVFSTLFVMLYKVLYPESVILTL